MVQYKGVGNRSTCSQKAGSHLFCLRRVVTGSVYEMIWTHVATQE